MAIKITKPNDVAPKFKYRLKDGTLIEYDHAGELGAASVSLRFGNPYEPMTFEYDSFEDGRMREIARMASLL